ncbi:Peptidyl-prolyl isomerase cwc27 [Hypoxylon texense]
MSANCTAAPDAVPSDAGVAGIGVLLSFMITALISLLISASLVFQEARSNRRRAPPKPSVLRRKLLNGYSDQQILTGIGIQTVGLAQAESIAPYHFFLVWMLSLLSMAVHNATLLALARDFRRDWVLRWMRQLLMLANLVLSCVYGVYVLQAVRRGLNNATFPVACAWRPETPDGPAPADEALSYAGTVAVIVGNVVIFALATWYLHSRALRFYAATQVVGLLLMAAFAVGATARVALLADAFAAPPIRLADRGEQQWSFGQLLSVGMLVLPVVSVVEIVRGEVRCAPPVAAEHHDDDDKGRLLDGEAQGGRGQELRTNSGAGRPEFQPNPFWGSQTNLFRK